MQAQTNNDGAAEAITDQTALTPKNHILMESTFPAYQWTFSPRR
ncbi:hypothetical protein BJ917_5246 [Pseudomonas sp. WPR_5_2]|nr:hypothetical protein BJ917_5246 [Pseudomonas sp. WPR_5_2]